MYVLNFKTNKINDNVFVKLKTVLIKAMNKNNKTHSRLQHLIILQIFREKF